MTDHPVVEGQATISEGVPNGWGTVITDPAVARERVDWGGLTPIEGDDGPGADYRNFESGEQCLIIIVGILKKGFGLEGFDGPSYENGTLHVEAEPYKAYPPDEGEPKYHYDYSFLLANLNGLSAPREVAVDIHTPSTTAT